MHVPIRQLVREEQLGVEQSLPDHPVIQEQLLGPTQFPFPLQSFVQENTLHLLPLYPALQLQVFKSMQVPLLHPEGQAKVVLRFEHPSLFLFKKFNFE